MSIMPASDRERGTVGFLLAILDKDSLQLGVGVEAVQGELFRAEPGPAPAADGHVDGAHGHRNVDAHGAAGQVLCQPDCL